MLTIQEYIIEIVLAVIAFFLIVKGVKYLVRKNDEEGAWRMSYKDN